jgi:integrase
MKFKEKFTRVCNTEGKPITTQRAYWDVARKFCSWLGALSEDDLRVNPTENFKAFISEEADRKISKSTQDLKWHALRFMFEKVLDIRLGDVRGCKRVSNEEEVMVDVPPMDVALKLVNSVGGDIGLALRVQLAGALRVSDVLRIRVKDVDLRRKQIAIQRSKGGSSRMMKLPDSLVPEIKLLLERREATHEADLRNKLGWVHLPGKLAVKYKGFDKSLEWQYLFAADRISQDPITKNFGRFHILPSALQRAMALARKKFLIRKHYTPHTLRHATAQWWEANGVHRGDIQVLLGHKSIETTERYLLSGRAGTPKNLPTPL